MRNEAGKDGAKAIFAFFIAPVLILIAIALAFTAPFILALIVAGFFGIRHFLRKRAANL